MNDITIFNSKEFGQVRTVDVNGQPHAVGVDVARALEYSSPSKAVIDHCKGITKLGIPSFNQHGAEVVQETNVIPVGDVYRLIFKAADQSRNPEIKAKAERFERWIFDEVIPSIHQTGTYSAKPTNNAAQLRAEAMKMNAENRRIHEVTKLISLIPRLSPIAVEVIGLKALEQATGICADNYLPACDKTYSATEVGAMFSITANAVGKIANQNNLKTDEYGKTVLDKSRYSPKQVETFRYNQRGVDRIGQLLGRQ